jgi:hypothetical protein
VTDREFGKKLIEEESLLHFADAYNDATGCELAIIARQERPDFLCQRGDGTLCGVELTQVRRDPSTRWAEQVAGRREWMLAGDAVAAIYDLALEKDRKRQQSDWQCPNDTILVLQLVDCPFGELATNSLDVLSEDLTHLGFSEIWLADYTTLDAFREVQLFCATPGPLQGLYTRAHPNRKPYG